MGIQLENLTYYSGRFTESTKKVVYLDFAPGFPSSPSIVAVLPINDVKRFHKSQSIFFVCSLDSHILKTLSKSSS